MMLQKLLQGMHVLGIGDEEVATELFKTRSVGHDIF